MYKFHIVKLKIGEIKLTYQIERESRANSG
jgi:hypothetical protein